MAEEVGMSTCEAVLWELRTGVGGRDLPANWVVGQGFTRVFSLAARWSRQAVLTSVSTAGRDDEGLLIDSTAVRLCSCRREASSPRRVGRAKASVGRHK